MASNAKDDMRNMICKKSSFSTNSGKKPPLLAETEESIYSLSSGTKPPLPAGTEKNYKTLSRR
jgi:hypothetical protein